MFKFNFQTEKSNEAIDATPSYTSGTANETTVEFSLDQVRPGYLCTGDAVQAGTSKSLRSSFPGPHNQQAAKRYDFQMLPINDGLSLLKV